MKKSISKIILIISLSLFVGFSNTPCLADESTQLKHALETLGAMKYLEALKLLTPLADNGNPTAATKLAELYRYGLGVERDYTTARKWFEIGAKGSDIDAIDSLAWLVENGIGGSKDKQRAMALHEQAARLGSSHAQYCM